MMKMTLCVASPIKTKEQSRFEVFPDTVCFGPDSNQDGRSVSSGGYGPAIFLWRHRGRRCPPCWQTPAPAAATAAADETNVLPPPDGDTPPVKQSCHIFHAAVRSLKRRALAAVIVLIYLFMAQTEGTAPPSAPLLATYGRHLSPFAAIGLNDFIN